jgi:rhamnose utilization protein RhaD (predicted bifunctional aldolase and dehydrogenase)
MTDPDLSALARISAEVGADITLVQGAGGNASLKEDGVLWVKASGTWLADAEAKPIFVPVELAEAHRRIAAGIEKMPSLRPDGPLRPSIETSLHALLPHRVVLHVHGVNSLARGAQAGAEAALAPLLAGLDWAWLPYCQPGLPLTEAVARLSAARPADVLVLGNHGLVVGADVPEAAATLAREVERRLALPGRAGPPADCAALEQLAAGTPYRPARDADSHAAATDPDNCRIATGGSLYPDHVVFLGRGAAVLPAGAKPPVEGPNGGPPPACLLVPGLGTLARADLVPGAEAMLRCLGLVAGRLPAAARVTYLSAQDEDRLLNWEAEAFRHTLARA